MKKVITKKDETIKYNFDYIKKNLDLNKFISLLDTKCLTPWYLDPNVYLEDGDERKDIFNYAIECCVNEFNNDPNIKNNETLPQCTEVEALNTFFDLYEFEQDSVLYTPKDGDISETLKLGEETEEYKNDGTLLEKISSNFKLSYQSVKIAQSIEEFKDKNFTTHSIVYSKINNKYYYVYNKSLQSYNLIVSIHKKQILEHEFITLLYKFGEDSIIDEKGHTIADLGKNQDWLGI